ncbi:MAG: SpoIIE family protein phosphatase [Bacteroidales bacterium]|nr:SpoIIE family protein phosphatase [Bacteroidales bacterium]
MKRLVVIVNACVIFLVLCCNNCHAHGWVSSGANGYSTHNFFPLNDKLPQVVVNNKVVGVVDSGGTLKILSAWYGSWWFGLLVAALFFAVFMYYNNTKLQDAQKRESALKEQLAEQNKELNLSNKQLAKQQEALKAKNEELTTYKDEIENSFHILEVLREFGKNLSTSLKIDYINEIMYDYVKQFIDIQAFGIGIYNEQVNAIVYPCFIENGKRLPPFTKHLDDENSLTVYCFVAQQELFITDINAQYRKYVPALNRSATQKLSQSRIHIPLTVKNTRIGILVINSYEKNAYTREDFNNIRTLASYVSIALDNARAHDTINNINISFNKSINSAQGIQNALLPSNVLLEKYFNMFVYFKPRNIVSGDFYWFAPIEKDPQKPLRAVLCVGDCTGHGVPGMLNTIIGNYILNEVVNLKGIHNPAEILEMVNAEFQKSLKQHELQNSEAIDVALIYLEASGVPVNGANGNNQYKIYFSGAKLPIIIYRAQKSELETYKGARKSIGGLRAKRSKVSFNNVEINAQPGDMLYMFTDGIIDQHSSERERFSIQRLHTLLCNIASKETKKQYDILDQTLDDHMKNEKQTDDITVIGIKL